MKLLVRYKVIIYGMGEQTFLASLISSKKCIEESCDGKEILLNYGIDLNLKADKLISTYTPGNRTIFVTYFLPNDLLTHCQSHIRINLLI